MGQKRLLIRAHRAEFDVRAMCRVLRVHFSGFYAWLKEPLSRRAQDDARQTELIRQAWSESGRVYGYSNPKRKHTNNGILSPVDFKTRQRKLNEASV